MQCPPATESEPHIVKAVCWRRHSNCTRLSVCETAADNVWCGDCVYWSSTKQLEALNSLVIGLQSKHHIDAYCVLISYFTSHDKPFLTDWCVCERQEPERKPSSWWQHWGELSDIWHKAAWYPLHLINTNGSTWNLLDHMFHRNLNNHSSGSNWHHRIHPQSIARHWLVDTQIAPSNTPYT